MWEPPQSGRIAVLRRQIISGLEMKVWFFRLVGCSRCKDRLVVAACHSTPILPPAASTVLFGACCSPYSAVLNNEVMLSEGSWSILRSPTRHIIAAPAGARADAVAPRLRASFFVRFGLSLGRERHPRAAPLTGRALAACVGRLLLCLLSPAYVPLKMRSPGAASPSG